MHLAADLHLDVTLDMRLLRAAVLLPSEDRKLVPGSAKSGLTIAREIHARLFAE
jgi:hypothetical protein